MVKYAIICYDTLNIGDEIQSLAMKRLLPRVDYYVQRDNYSIVYDVNFTRVDISKLEKASITLFVNGWFDLVPKFPTFINPKIVSMHMTSNFLKNIKDLAQIDIGCRDENTYNCMQKEGRTSVFVGCPTTTFQKYEGERDNNIYYVDVTDLQYNKYKQELDPEGKYIHTRITHIYRDKKPLKERFIRAQELLGKYQKAHHVVTSRLHCLLPCRAMNTPVIFTDTNNDTRFIGLVDQDYSIIATKVRDRVSSLLPPLSQ